MRGYVSLLLPAQLILVVVAATNAPPTDTTSAGSSVTAVSHGHGTVGAQPSHSVTQPGHGLLSSHVTLPGHADPHLTPSATAGPETTGGAAPSPHSVPGNPKVTTSRGHHGNTGSPAQPQMTYSLHQNVFVVTCYSASDLPNIHYELIQDSKVVQNLTLRTNQPANFTIQTPGIYRLQCRARSPSGHEALSQAADVRVLTGNQDVPGPTVQRGVSAHPPGQPDKPSGAEEADGEGADVGHDYHLRRAAILTSVTQAVQHINILILCVCGPALLLVLFLVILVTYFRKHWNPQKERLITL